MRSRADAERVESFMRLFGERARVDANVHLTGGATAVLIGWRESTIGVDLKLQPEDDRLLRLLPALKEELQLNLELASPADFIPSLPGWEERSLFVARHGSVNFYHYDLYAQALSKVERGHEQDRQDVTEMVRRGLVQPSVALESSLTCTDTRPSTRRRFGQTWRRRSGIPTQTPRADPRAHCRRVLTHRAIASGRLDTPN